MRKPWSPIALMSDERGVALVLTMIVGLILFVLIAAFIPMMVNEMSLTTVQRKSGQAFYVAEAGLDQAVWTLQQGNNWQTYYNSATPMTEQGTVGEGQYTITYEASTSSANQMKVTSQGHVPADGSAEMKRTVEAIAVNTRFPAFNHAMQSQSTIANWANPAIEYGDVYAKGNINFQASVPNAPNYYAFSFTRNDNSIIVSDYGNLHVITEPEFPDLTQSDLDFLKDFARKTDTYYQHAAGSSLEFTSDDLAAINAANPEGAIVFVDTPSGGPYPESKADVRVQTNSYFNGVFVVKGDLYIAGNGSGTVIGQDEDGNPVTLEHITFNGHVYAAGAYDWSGTPGIYGSLVAGSIAGNGTPNVWYNVSFRNRPLLPTVLGAIELVSWHEIK